MFNDIINAIPYIFMILHSVGLWNAKDDIKEIKHITLIIMWIVIVIGYKIAGM